MSKLSVRNISDEGFWIALAEEELFVPFDRFPWFRGTSIEKLAHVELPHAGHLYWPDLDIDLAVESIRYPDRFPLVAKERPFGR